MAAYAQEGETGIEQIQSQQIRGQQQVVIAPLPKQSLKPPRSPPKKASTRVSLASQRAGQLQPAVIESQRQESSVVSAEAHPEQHTQHREESEILSK